MITTMLTCDCCGKPMEKAHRKHLGARYCQRCYSREFKRLICSDCGMFKRLLRSEAQPRCQACIAALPCVRCRRIGQPVGAMTEFGPACASCRVYFLKPKPCELCSKASNRLSSVVTEEGTKQACPRCITKHHRSCADCRRYRPCKVSKDGKWRCRACIESGMVACGICMQPMPAGLGKRCEECYWRERLQRNAHQLVELISRPRVRDAFLSFSEWLFKADQDLQRRARRLKEYATFFVTLDRVEDEPWTGHFLLMHFGTAALRRYELPVRWLETHNGVQLSHDEKVREADLRRVREADLQLPSKSFSRALLKDFASELIRRYNAGELSPRSARLAIRPAIDLLNLEDPSGSRLPQQATVDQYLARVPGQRAALSTFLGYLKASRALHLRLPAKPSATSSAARKALERRIATLILEPGQSGELSERWILLALRYFHRISSAAAKEITLNAVRNDTVDSLELQFEGRVYWIPKKPMLPQSATQQLSP